jgi:hypothetical protein
LKTLAESGNAGFHCGARAAIQAKLAPTLLPSGLLRYGRRQIWQH